MTVSKALTDWLKKYPLEIQKGYAIVVDNENLAAYPDSCGLYRTPQRNVQEFTSDDYMITEGYQLLIRQSSKGNTERLESDEWLENLAYWVDDMNYNGELPVLDGGRVCQGVVISSAPYLFQQDEDSNIYQVSLSVTYRRTFKEYEGE